VYGWWENHRKEGYHVLPYEDAECSNAASLPMPYYYTDMGGFCATFDNSSNITPNNPRCFDWTSRGNPESVIVCKGPEKTCNGTQFKSKVVCSPDGGATCVTYQSNAPTKCVSGAGWPMLNAPAAKVEYVAGLNDFGVKDNGCFIFNTTFATFLAIALLSILL